MDGSTKSWPSSASSGALLHPPDGAGEMESLIDSLDWSRTLIGPRESWSPALNMIVRLVLANRFPMLLWWGPEFCQIYNDPYRPVLGTKHPKSLGQPANECWPEIWPVIGPLIETPFHGGPATWVEDLELEVNRHGYTEETHFTVAYSPVPDETAAGGIGGVLATVHETSEKVIGQRRVAVLRDLGARSAEAKTAEDACRIVAQTLGRHPRDLPFALLYLLDDGCRTARLAGSAGVAAGEDLSPLVVEVENGGVWPFPEVARTETIRLVEDLADRFARLPSGPWSDPPRSAAVVPVRSSVAHRVAGFLVAGVSSRIAFDDRYHVFLDLTASQVAAAIATARVYENERRSSEALQLSFRELTERKRAEAALEESHRHLNLHVDHSPLAVIEWDSDFRITRWAGTADQVFGWTADETLGRRIDELPWIYPEDAPLVNEVMGDMLSGKRPSNVSRNRNIRKDGSAIHCEWYNSSIRDDAGRLISVLSQVLDVTERKRFEQALRTSEEHFRRLYEAGIIGIVAADTESVFEANDVFLNMIGCSREDLEAGRIRWREITPPEYIRLDERGIAELLATGSCKPFEKELIRKDGSRVPILIGATQLERSPLKWLCFVVDLTERKELERRLFEKQKLESIGLLAGGIAHDFNNLLVGILGNASLARDMAPQGSGVAQSLGEIMKAAERAAHLTRQMLAYSGKGRFVIEPVNLSNLVQEITKLLRPSISKKVALTLELDADPPPVEADPGQMQQVVMNLVLNAAEAIGEEPGLVVVKTGKRNVDRRYIREALGGAIEPGTYAFLEVRDTGSGMDEATKVRIFDPFFTTKFTGRGLGLAAVAGIVRGHKGAIRVSSAPGRGSTFLVLFPAAASPEPAVEAPPPPAADSLPGAGTVLVVDDEDVVRRIAKAALERHGHRVLVADGGAAAIEALKRERDCIGVVLLDLSMPGLSGHETLPLLRQIKPDIEVIVSSGYSEEEMMRLFAGQSISGFIQKPYTPDRLARKVKDTFNAPLG
jgi:PAS domain S-box-containing protein